MQKHIVHKLPHKVKVIENDWIPLSDGTRLSCRLWLPLDGKPQPAILEYIPYRKRDGTRTRDEPMHGYFAGHGYACVRVDMRGSGESDGLLLDEYLLQEQEDALEVIEWIRNQVWCNGRIGMMGKSWGGFNSLQVAARRPAGLEAIITVCFSDNRFTSDIHWKDGCLLNDNFWWGSIMLAYQSRPIDPVIVGERWKDMWLHRLENMPLNIADWTEHQTYDQYWMHGSVCEHYNSINIPVMAVSGWADSYTNCVFTLLPNIRCPVKGIVGPWAHIYPQDGVPEPAIGFLQESLNWWDKWLKNKEDGKTEESLKVWIEHYMPPNVQRPQSEGHWVTLSPSIHSHCTVQTMLLDNGRLLDTNDTVNKEFRYVLLKTPLNHGLLSGEWMGAGVSGESPADQRLDDGLAMVFDGPILNQDIDILGIPTFTVRLTCDKPKAMLFAQLSDVAPDGAVRRVSFGIKNLTLSMDGKEIMYLQEGKELLVSIKLDYCGYRFSKGHRIRLSLANSFWPMFWVSPEINTLRLDLDSARFSLPVLTTNATAGPNPKPETAVPTPITKLRPGFVNRSITYDITKDEWTCITDGVGGVFGEGVYRFDEIDTTVEHNLKRELRLSNKDPLSAYYSITQKMKMGRPGWEADIDINTRQTCDADYLHIHAEIKARMNNELVFEKNWYRRVYRESF
ncbi:putative dipeptidyl-peptidase [Trypanosoma theileri]|uniref:Putative dipeptidyl-peptidase n=1 Tax=Trypanosoma theileri TaxID=67003 RepID=A0A1X0NRA9_9TRYP|nr:putative dipeptidyl-peptidase [Trypanosoma theileri]ORC87078.1 putative dipeptidyl-peptidase [Trypanosoma theileri]